MGGGNHNTIIKQKEIKNNERYIKNKRNFMSI